MNFRFVYYSTNKLWVYWNSFIVQDLSSVKCFDMFLRFDSLIWWLIKLWFDCLVLMKHFLQFFLTKFNAVHSPIFYGGWMMQHKEKIVILKIYLAWIVSLHHLNLLSLMGFGCSLISHVFFWLFLRFNGSFFLSFFIFWQVIFMGSIQIYWGYLSMEASLRKPIICSWVITSTVASKAWKQYAFS